MEASVLIGMCNTNALLLIIAINNRIFGCVLSAVNCRSSTSFLQSFTENHWEMWLPFPTKDHHSSLSRAVPVFCAAGPASHCFLALCSVKCNTTHHRFWQARIAAGVVCGPQCQVVWGLLEGIWHLWGLSPHVSEAGWQIWCVTLEGAAGGTVQLHHPLFWTGQNQLNSEKGRDKNADPVRVLHTLFRVPTGVDTRDIILLFQTANCVFVVLTRLSIGWWKKCWRTWLALREFSRTYWLVSMQLRRKNTRRRKTFIS